MCSTKNLSLMGKKVKAESFTPHERRKGEPFPLLRGEGGQGFEVRLEVKEWGTPELRFPKKGELGQEIGQASGSREYTLSKQREGNRVVRGSHQFLTPRGIV